MMVKKIKPIIIMVQSLIAKGSVVGLGVAIKVGGAVDSGAGSGVDGGVGVDVGVGVEVGRFWRNRDLQSEILRQRHSCLRFFKLGRSKHR